MQNKFSAGWAVGVAKSGKEGVLLTSLQSSTRQKRIAGDSKTIQKKIQVLRSTQGTELADTELAGLSVIKKYQQQEVLLAVAKV